MAGEVTLKAGSKARTREVWTFAADNWAALGQQERAAELRKRVALLSRGTR